MPYLAGFVTPQDYGAAGNGTTDDTTAVQNAVNSGAPVFFPPGTYLISSAVALPTTAYLFGSGCGTYNVTAGPGLSIIKLANASNSSMFTIAAGNAAGVIKDIQFNGNKANQTGGGSAILWSSAGSAQESQWHLERVFVHDSFSSGFETQTNRQNNKFTECVSYNNGGYGINCSASDSAVINCTIGLNTLDGVLTSYVCHISGSDIFSNRTGINIPTGIRGVEVTNCGIDRNNQHGIYIAGSSVDVVACTIHSNGQSATNTYGSITVDNTFGAMDSVTISHCNFWLDAGITNLPNYHIEFATSTVTAQVSACSFQAASFATGTVSSASQAVQTTVKNVLVGGTAALGDNGVGEMQLANATTVPTTNPTGGGLVYAKNNTAWYRDANGVVSPMVSPSEVSASPTGALGETIPRYAVNSATQAIGATTGTVYMVGVWLPAGLVVTNINWVTGSTAAGTPTHWWLGIADSGGVQRGHTADQTTGAIAANTLISKALTSAYTTTTTGLYYLLISVTATTNPTASGIAAPTNMGVTSPLLAGVSPSAAQSTPGTDGTTTYTAPTTAGGVPYVYVS